MENHAQTRPQSRLLSLLGRIAARPVRYFTAEHGPLHKRERAQLTGRVYVITGASSGIGRGLALALAAEGAHVVLAARRTGALVEMAHEIELLGGQALAVTTDVSSAEAVQRLAAMALDRFGRIDVWVNNAGVGAIGHFEQIPLEDHARLIDVNLKGALFGSHVAIAQFKRQGAGVLINVGSAESELPVPYHASYAAAKHALLGLGRSLNEELQLAGMATIGVATVMPWATDTPFFSNAANYTGHEPRALMLDDATTVVNALIRTSITPREEVPVGWKGKLVYHSHRLFDDLSERLTARSMHWLQFKMAPAAQKSAGAVHAPSATPATVAGGMRERQRGESAGRLQRQAASR